MLPIDFKALSAPFAMHELEWRDVPGFPGYRISSRGDVIGKRYGTLMKPQRLRNGYLRVVLCRDGEATRFLLHRLVLTSFIGPPGPGQVACHGDGSRDNNHVSNLRWGTFKENVADTLRHGTHQRGEGHSRLKLSNEKVWEIRRRYAAGGCTYFTLAREFGVDFTMIGFIVQRKSWSHI